MRGPFDDEEDVARSSGRDTELTLGTGALLAIPLGLLLLCGVCFGLGYLVGHRTSGPATASQSAAPTPAPDQEPLQANGAIPKPSAAEGVPVPAPPSSDTPATATDSGAVTTAAPVSTASAAAVPVSAGTAPSAPAAVRPAMSSSAPATAQAGAAPAVHAALPPPAQSFMVQIAAVSNLEDANVLTNALRTRGYAVSDRREPTDGMIHVRIGPFSSREEANHWRDKLLGDGYNALVQP